MSDITETTRIVKVTDFVQECPPAVLTSETVPGPGGRLRLFTQKIQVPDADLWAHLTKVVEKGDFISATVKTVWPDEGRYYTILVSLADRAAPQENTASPRRLLEAAGSPT